MTPSNTPHIRRRSPEAEYFLPIHCGGNPVQEMERVCLDAYDAGRSRPLQDVINECRAFEEAKRRDLTGYTKEQ